MASALLKRIKRLESRRQDARTLRVLTYAPGSPIVGTPLHARRVMLAPDFGSDDAWQAAAMKQQHKLLSQAQEKRR